MLTTRRKGSIIYVRGTVRVGKQVIKVPERSTGFSKTKDAAEYISKLEADIRWEILNPNADRSHKVSFDECAKNYMDKRRLKIGELQKIDVLVPYFEGKKVSEVLETWNTFCADKKHLALSTLNRYADTLKAILKTAEKDLNVKLPEINKYKVKNKIVFFLPDETRQKLLECYSECNRDKFTIYSLQGFREQELLQLDWLDIHLRERAIIIRESKNGETRSVPMHKKVWWILARLYIKNKCPVSGHVFLNVRGEPYRDCRKTGGGSPLQKTHQTALARLKKNHGIKLKMRIHDWRHDWAARMVMAGVDLLTLQKLGGWKSIEMVERYATFSKKHEFDAIDKI